jgi:hypothetical protein
MERGSIIRETGAAMTTANNTGTMKDRSRLVSSMISTTAEIGPHVVAARTAPAPTAAVSAGGQKGPNTAHL